MAQEKFESFYNMPALEIEAATVTAMLERQLALVKELKAELASIKIEKPNG